MTTTDDVEACLSVSVLLILERQDDSLL